MTGRPTTVASANWSTRPVPSSSWSALPLSLDGSVGAAAQRALDEVEDLAAALRVPVETWDERLSTVTAERSLMEQDMRAPARRRVVDKVAAAVILQSWLDAHQPMTEARADEENP